MPGSDSERRSLLWLAVICALALALRAVVIANTQEAGIFADMQDYHDRAVHLLRTGTLWPDAFRVPLYPIFIAGVFKLFGESLVAVRIAQAVLGVATVALTYAVAKRVTTEGGALIAASVVAIYPALVLYSVYLMAETLFAFFVVLAIALWTIERPWAALATGVAIGAATLTRSTGMAVAGGIVLAEAFRLITRNAEMGNRTLARIALVLVGFALVLAPWMQRNYAMYGRLIPTDTAAGFNALLGNFEGATGRHPGIPAVDAAAEQYWSGTRNDLERSDVGLAVARDFVVKQPLRAADLAVRKVAYLFGVEGREHAWGYSFHLHGRRGAGTVWAWGMAIIISFPILMTLASIGAWRPGLSASAVGVTLVATLACVAAIHIASFGDSRFHLPWIPLLAIAAARAFAPLSARPWTMSRQVVLAVWWVCFALAWKDQAAELLRVLPQLAASPVPLQLPY
jgi:4-amino-4-deoxy-L-arabinose transferase-like glycosyltransferase